MALTLALQASQQQCRRLHQRLVLTAQLLLQPFDISLVLLMARSSAVKRNSKRYTRRSS
jgi:hypothetical protein